VACRFSISCASRLTALSFSRESELDGAETSADAPAFFATRKIDLQKEHDVLEKKLVIYSASKR